jgi:hypothetical protein
MSKHSLPASEIRMPKRTVTEYRLSPAALNAMGVNGGAKTGHVAEQK